MSEPTWELLGGPGVIGGPVDYVGNWAAGTTYQPGQVVRYNGVDYIAVNPSLGQVPPAARSSMVASYGTTLPASPFDGQEAILVDNVTNPAYAWRMRYNAQSTSPYEWEFIGGSDYVQYASLGVYGAVSSGWSALSPIFVTPRVGDWDTEEIVQFTNTSAPVPALAQICAGTTGPVNPINAGVITYVGAHLTIGNSSRLTGLAAGTQISPWVYCDTAFFQTANRSFRVKPVRLA
jgi:hypothetical protein